MSDHPHRRHNPLTDEWVLVSPHRSKRPWHGKVEATESRLSITHDADCLLCAGNTRINGEVNDNYKDIFVFDNDFPSILETFDNSTNKISALFNSTPISGKCRVICFSPDHSQTLADMDVSEIKKIINTWQEQTEELSKANQTVQIFENKGAIMGCSNPHPHCQIWANNVIPTEIAKESKTQKEYYETHGNLLLLDYVKEELNKNERILLTNEHWVTLVPYWAKWPFETMILPRFKITDLTELDAAKTESLAEIMKKHLQMYDNLFDSSMPYTMGWHQSSFDGNDNEHFTLHAHYYPPVLRSATNQKFMVGYEMMAEPQRDITPEEAAQKLRDSI